MEVEPVQELQPVHGEVGGGGAGGGEEEEEREEKGKVGRQARRTRCSLLPPGEALKGN